MYHFGVTVTLTTDLYNNPVRIISPILFELKIPNLVLGCILGWQSVMYQVLDLCDLDLFTRIIVSGAYLLFYLR